MAKPHVKDLSNLMTRINTLDLDCIKIQLMNEAGWGRAYADTIEAAYKRYLFLSVTQSVSIVPTKEIDEFWHTHILDTRKYMEDCEQVFGFYVHHFPYFGLRGEDDVRDLLAAFEQTKVIWESVFGESLAYSVETTERQHAGQCCGANCDIDPDAIYDSGMTHRHHVRPSFQTTHPPC